VNVNVIEYVDVKVGVAVGVFDDIVSVTVNEDVAVIVAVQLGVAVLVEVNVFVGIVVLVCVGEPDKYIVGVME